MRTVIVGGGSRAVAPPLVAWDVTVRRIVVRSAGWTHPSSAASESSLGWYPSIILHLGER